MALVYAVKMEKQKLLPTVLERSKEPEKQKNLADVACHFSTTIGILVSKGRVWNKDLTLNGKS